MTDQNSNDKKNANRNDKRDRPKLKWHKNDKQWQKMADKTAMKKMTKKLTDKTEMTTKMKTKTKNDKLVIFNFSICASLSLG